MVNRADDPQPPAKAVDIDHSLIVEAIQHNPAMFDVPVMTGLAIRSKKIANLFVQAGNKDR